MNYLESLEIDQHLNLIIDCNHPLFFPVSDEEIVDDHNEEPFYTDYRRTFAHENGVKFVMNWRVYDGNESTVRTVFYPATRIEKETV